MKMSPVTKQDQIPDHEHYQIIIFDQLTTDDGYGGNYSETVTKIYICIDSIELQDTLNYILKDDEIKCKRTKYIVQKIAYKCSVEIKIQVKT